MIATALALGHMSERRLANADARPKRWPEKRDNPLREDNLRREARDGPAKPLERVLPAGVNTKNLRKGAAMDHSEFVAEGTLDVGPSAQYFGFRDGEYLGQQVVEHFKWNNFELPEERGYTRLARVRVSIERLENQT
jgi:hypothetical protein